MQTQANHPISCADKIRQEVYAAPVDYQAHCACVKCIELTCRTSCGLYDINVRFWQTPRQQKWLWGVCKFMCCSDTILPQCGCISRIVGINPAQKGLKLCFTCKASHAQDPAQTEQIPSESSTRCAWTVPKDVLLQDMVLAQLACTDRTAITKCRTPVLGIKSTPLGVQSRRMRCRYSILVKITMAGWSTRSWQTQPSTVCTALLMQQ